MPADASRQKKSRVTQQGPGEMARVITAGRHAIPLANAVVGQPAAFEKARHSSRRSLIEKIAQCSSFIFFSTDCSAVRNRFFLVAIDTGPSSRMCRNNIERKIHGCGASGRPERKKRDRSRKSLRLPEKLERATNNNSENKKKTVHRSRLLSSSPRRGGNFINFSAFFASGRGRALSSPKVPPKKTILSRST